MAGEVFDGEAARRFSDARCRTGSPAQGGGDECCSYYGCCGSAEHIGAVVLPAAKRHHLLRLFEHRWTLCSIDLGELHVDRGHLAVTRSVGRRQQAVRSSPAALPSPHCDVVDASGSGLVPVSYYLGILYPERTTTTKV